jgi:hypothetical protein
MQFLNSKLDELLEHFASGAEVEPGRILPRLQRIQSGTWESDLFRLASLTWSVPVSAGFGRRIRYLVWDRSNEKLIGIAAIGDPVFNLSARDNLIGWSTEDRVERLVNVMDAYVLGAVPPYNFLLGGKAIACMLRSTDVYDDFRNIYGNTTGIISGKSKRARLLAVTTTSSMGRSSVYNRLKLGGVEYFRPLGFTTGWGHFHVPDELFDRMREFLRAKQHSYADEHQFGAGPNWKLRTVKAALSELGFKSGLMKHGVQRQVFLAEMAENSLKILAGEAKRIRPTSLLGAEEIGELAVERWMAPRAARRPEYFDWMKASIRELIMKGHMTVAEGREEQLASG